MTRVGSQRHRKKKNRIIFVFLPANLTDLSLIFIISRPRWKDIIKICF